MPATDTPGSTSWPGRSPRAGPLRCCRSASRQLFGDRRSGPRIVTSKGPDERCCPSDLPSPVPAGPVPARGARRSAGGSRSRLRRGDRGAGTDGAHQPPLDIAYSGTWGLVVRVRLGRLDLDAGRHRLRGTDLPARPRSSGGPHGQLPGHVQRVPGRRQGHHRRPLLLGQRVQEDRLHLAHPELRHAHPADSSATAPRATPPAAGPSTSTKSSSCPTPRPRPRPPG